MVYMSGWFILMMLKYIGRKLRTIKKSAQSLVVASKNTAIEVNGKYMVMSRDWNVR